MSSWALGADLSDGNLKFGGLEVQKVYENLTCHQLQYLAQRVATSKLPSVADRPVGTTMNKTAVKRAAGTIDWMATMTCTHSSFLVPQLNQLECF